MCLTWGDLASPLKGGRRVPELTRRSEKSAAAIVPAAHGREGPNGEESESRVRYDRAGHQKSVEQIELPLEDRGEASGVQRSGEAPSAGRADERSGLDTSLLMERVLEGGNLRRALKRVQQNEGSPGVDGLTVDELPAYLRDHWSTIREQLLTGRYQPCVVKRVEIPKPGGGVRLLGIPTVLDRFIQQAVLQVLQPVIDPTFSESGYGFRAGAPTTQSVRRNGTCRVAGAGWWTWTWSSSSTASTTMCSWGWWRSGSRIPGFEHSSAATWKPESW
jgi:hypothetical protein